MSNEHFYSRGKVIQDEEFEIRRFVILNQITHDGKIVGFNQRMQLLLETESVFKTLLDDEVVKEGSNYHDFYGFFTSFQESLYEAFRNEKLTTGNGRVGELTTKLIWRYGVRDDGDSRFASPQPRYRYIPDDWIIIGDRGNSEETINAWFEAIKNNDPNRYDLSPHRVNSGSGEEILLWTSRDTPTQNRERFRALVLHFNALGAFSQDDVEKQMARYDEEYAKALTKSE